jgi:phosphoribosylformimino-5-aminoimidazole carboxamide ribotide isomerase
MTTALPMKIIPVIDLKDGVVVHARLGLRDQYQPIDTQLCQSADLFQVMTSFLALADFDCFYIADLNAITGLGHHEVLIAELLKTYPQKTFWIDSGYQVFKDYAANHLPVLGSECYSEDQILELNAFKKRFILSLDYGASGALGAPSLFSDQSLWPETIIIMTLNRVGSQQGPDLETLTDFCKRYPKHRFVAAGGIRHNEDLQALTKIDIQQALLASALHSGDIVPSKCRPE